MYQIQIDRSPCGFHGDFKNFLKPFPKDHLEKVKRYLRKHCQVLFQIVDEKGEVIYRHK